MLRSNVGVAIAWATVFTEGALSVALWFRPTRAVAAGTGTVMSVIFIYAAHNDTVWDVAYIIVLTMLLVVSYLAFFCPIRADLDAGSVREPGRRTAPRSMRSS